MKIGLIAMSGLRVHDPRLIEFGMTLPGVMERGKVVSSLPSLGLLYVAAVTPAHHEFEYFEVDQPDAPPAGIFDCDVVAISALTAQAFDTYALCDQLRQSGVIVVMGGLHASVLPDEALEHADHVVIGEAEHVWPHVIQAIEADAEGQIWNANQFDSVRMNELPVPRYDLLRNRNYQRYPVQTSRGCPWRCEFCASSVMLRQTYRRRPAEDIVQDIEAVRKICERPFIEFADDNTFVDRAWGKELCRQLKPLNISWFAETDISVADDDELLSLIYHARCRQLLIGLESPSESGLQGIELNADFKARRWSEAGNSVRKIQGHGITVNGCFILGLDGHTPDIFQNVLDFANEYGLFDVQITVMTAFPGTPLYQRLQREDRILEPGRWDLCTLFDVNYRPTHMSPDELREGVYWLAEQLYNEDSQTQRRRQFFENKPSRAG